MRIHRSPQFLRAPIAALTASLRCRMSDPKSERMGTSLALEAARNIVQGLAVQDHRGAWYIEGDPEAVGEAIEDALGHRIKCGWLHVAGLTDAVNAATLAWLRAIRPQRRAA